MISSKIVAGIKQKCTQEEIFAILNEFPEDDSDQMNALKVSKFYNYQNFWVYFLSGSINDFYSSWKINKLEKNNLKD